MFKIKTTLGMLFNWELVAKTHAVFGLGVAKKIGQESPLITQDSKVDAKSAAIELAGFECNVIVSNNMKKQQHSHAP